MTEELVRYKCRHDVSVDAFFITEEIVASGLKDAPKWFTDELEDAIDYGDGVVAFHLTSDLFTVNVSEGAWIVKGFVPWLLMLDDEEFRHCFCEEER